MKAEKLYYNCLEQNIKDEVWKEHPIYSNYEGSNLGRIRNKKTKRILSQRIINNGRLYTNIFLNKKTKIISVSRFILSCFTYFEKTLHCDHINSNKIDNKIDNLRWVTPKENNSNPNSIKKRHKISSTNANLPVECYDDNNNLIKTFTSITEAAKYYGCTDGNISAVCVGKRKRANGFIWKYKKNELLNDEVFKKHKILNIEVSNKGRVKYVKNNGAVRITYGTLDKRYGYFRCFVNGKSYSVHRLVAETFIPNEENKEFVNHIDSNKGNNNVNNLEWCTRSENMLSENTYKKISRMVNLYTNDGKFIKTYPSIKAMSKELGLNPSNVGKCLNEKYKSYKSLKGYKFEYYKG